MDDNGTFTLTSLMGAWGTDDGLDEGQILSAIRQHLFITSSGPRGAKLRFGIDQQENGPIRIRIAPFGFRLQQMGGTRTQLRSAAYSELTHTPHGRCRAPL